MAFTNFGVGPTPPKKSAPPPPFGAKKPALDVVVGIGGPKKPMGEAPVQDDESAETPDMEASEDYGAKLVQDIEDAGASVGLDPAKARQAAGAFFAAAAKCLGGDNEQDEPPMGDMGDAAGDYPA